ncbi:MAG: YihY/virulence factor BrkB family protein [Actinomycetales bacterium]
MARQGWDRLVAEVRQRSPWWLRELVGEILEDRVLHLAAEAAFFAVISLFPAVLIVTGLLSFLDVIVGPDVSARVQQQVTDALTAILTDKASGLVTSVQHFFGGGYSGLLTFATVGALVSLSGAWATIIGALNLAYDTDERRSWWYRRLLGLVFALVTVVLVVLALIVLVLGPLLGRGRELADLVGLGDAFLTAWQVAKYPVLLAALAAWLVAVYHVAPNRQTRWRASVPGALFTAAAWVLATVGFHLYLVLVGARNPVLGAFGGGAIVMLWIYLLLIALLVGGELNEILARRYRDEGAAQPR